MAGPVLSVHISWMSRGGEDLKDRQGFSSLERCLWLRRVTNREMASGREKVDHEARGQNMNRWEGPLGGRGAEQGQTQAERLRCFWESGHN